MGLDMHPNWGQTHDDVTKHYGDGPGSAIEGFSAGGGSSEPASIESHQIEPQTYKSRAQFLAQARELTQGVATELNHGLPYKRTAYMLPDGRLIRISRLVYEDLRPTDQETYGEDVIVNIEERGPTENAWRLNTMYQIGTGKNDSPQVIKMHRPKSATEVQKEGRQFREKEIEDELADIDKFDDELSKNDETTPVQRNIRANRRGAGLIKTSEKISKMVEAVNEERASGLQVLEESELVALNQLLASIREEERVGVSRHDVTRHYDGPGSTYAGEAFS